MAEMPGLLTDHQELLDRDVQRNPGDWGEDSIYTAHKDRLLMTHMSRYLRAGLVWSADAERQTHRVPGRLYRHWPT